MTKFIIEGDSDPKTIEAENIWDAAGEFAANQVGFDTDEPHWLGFYFTIESVEFFAEIHELHGPHTGTVMVTQNQECRTYDEEGSEEAILS